MKGKERTWIKKLLPVAAPALVIFCAALVFLCREGLLTKVELPWQVVRRVEYRGRILPVMKGVAVNQYDTACFGRNELGWRVYEAHDRAAKIGVDVSVYQGEIDWQQVADSGVEFAMIRCGYRGYTEGNIKKDTCFEANLQGALEAGLDVGVYFFSQAITPREAEEEAEFVLDAIKGRQVTYPVVFDWEVITDSGEARTRGLEDQTLTDCAIAFCDRVARAGYEPAVYFNQDMGYLNYRLEQLSEYSFWLAEYNALPSFYYHFDLWQYTPDGTVPGIEGNVDLNLDFRSVDT